MDNLHVKYKACVEACLRANAGARYCAATCLKAQDINEFRTVIQLTLECASICRATADLLNMQSPFLNALLPLCAEICSSCAMECEKYSDEHFHECMMLSKHCAEECRLLLA